MFGCIVLDVLVMWIHADGEARVHVSINEGVVGITGINAQVA